MTDGSAPRVGDALRRRWLVLVAGLLAIVPVEVLLLPRAASIPATIAYESAAVASLLLVRRRPIAGLVAAIVLVPAGRHLALIAGGSLALMLVVQLAAFGAALLVPRRRLALVALAGIAYTAVHVVDHLTAAGNIHVTVPIFKGGLFAAAAAMGLLLRRREDRLAEVAAQRAAVERALAQGPSAALTQEQLRIWQAIQPRLEQVVGGLGDRARAARAALAHGAGESAMQLEAIRLSAVEALDHLHATLRLIDPTARGQTAPLPGGRPAPAVGATLEVLFGVQVSDTAQLTSAEVVTTLERLAGAVRPLGAVSGAHARLDADGLTLRFRVAAPAAGTDPLGLVAARVRLLGGRLDAHVRRSALHVRLTLPLGGEAVERPARAGRVPRPDGLVTLSVLLTAGGLVEQVTTGHAHHSGPAAAGLLAALVLGGGPVLAARRPVAAALVVGAGIWLGTAAGVLGEYSMLQNFAGMFTIAVGAASAGRGALQAAAVLALVGTGTLLGLHAEQPPWPLDGYVRQFAGLAAYAAAGFLLRETAAGYREAGARLDRLATALTDLERHAIGRERVRLARELHDLVGHALTSVALLAGAASAQVLRGRPRAAGALDALEHAADTAGGELARLRAVLTAGGVTPLDAGDDDPAAALRALTDGAARGGRDVRLAVDGDLAAPHPYIQQTLVRIAREAVTNAAKHAAGAPVDVTVEVGERDPSVLVRVVNGPGLGSGLPSGGQGLRAMADRVEACGGTLTCGPAAGGGWCVEATLPALPDPPADVVAPAAIENA